MASHVHLDFHTLPAALGCEHRDENCLTRAQCGQSDSLGVLIRKWTIEEPGDNIDGLILDLE